MSEEKIIIGHINDEIIMQNEIVPARNIIRISEGVDKDYALLCVDEVKKLGLISKTHKGKQYCFVVVFKIPDEDNKEVVVYCDRNSKSFTFRVSWQYR